MNTGDLIRCYNRSRSTVYLTSYRTWIKKYHRYLMILGYVIFSAIITVLKINWIITLTFVVIVSPLIVFYFINKRSIHLMNKYDGLYGLRLNRKQMWSETLTYKIRKARLKNILGTHIQNDILISRIKTQLSDEIAKNTRSLRTNIPIASFVTVFIAAYLTFNLKIIEASVGKIGLEVLNRGIDFLLNACILIGTTLVLIIVYKPKVEYWVNLYSNRLTDLLRIIQTIEIEHLSEKSGEDEKIHS